MSTTDAIHPRKSRNRPSANGMSSKNLALASREMIAHKWRNIALRLALGRFDWKGLPDSIDERYLEKTILLEGRAVFFKVGDELKATPVITETSQDEYENFSKLTAMGSNGWQYSIPENQGVMVWDTMSRIHTWPTVEWYIDALTEIDELRRVNRRQQRTATVFQGPAEAANDMRILAKHLEMGETAFVSEKFGVEGAVSAISTGVQYLQADFQADLQNVLNELYLFLGIEHMGMEKKAHVLESEAGITNDSVARIREDLLLPRQQAAEAVNKLFNTNITVEWRSYEKDNMENPSGVSAPTSEEK